MSGNNEYEKPLFFQLQYWINLIFPEISSTDPYKPNPYKPSCVYPNDQSKCKKWIESCLTQNVAIILIIIWLLDDRNWS